MISWIKTKYKLIKAKTELELESLNLAKQQISEAFNVAKKDDDSGWNLMYGSGGGMSTTIASDDDLDKAREQSRLFCEWNPHARGILRSVCKFVIGRGVTFSPKFKENVPNQWKRAYIDHWDAWVKKEKFLSKQKECVRRLVRDGEFFLRFIDDVSSGMPRIRFMEPDRIRDPRGTYNNMVGNTEVRGKLSYGIETSRLDIENVFFYYYVGEDGELEKKIPAKDVIHQRLFADSNRKRGVPFLKTMLYDLKVYRDWLKDRVVLNKIRTAIALVREIQPTSTGNLKSVRDDTKAIGDQWKSTKMQAPEAGTVITAKGVNYKFLSPQLDARDSAQDGRNILLTIASGAGLPEYMVTGDASNANYSSSMVAESPGVKEFEDMQDELKAPFVEIFDRVMESGRLYNPDVPKDSVVPECDLTFPTLIARDILKESQAFGTYVTFGVMSKRTVRGKLGIDNDVEMENIRAEKDDELEWKSEIEPIPGEEPTSVEKNPPEEEEEE